MSSDRRSDRLVPRLLSGRDRLSRIEKDAILEQVLGARTSRRTRWMWFAAPVLAAGVAILVIAPWRNDRAATETIAARGGSARAIASLHVTCAGACTPGAKLLFDLHGTTTFRYFAAFAQRDDGTVLWYFPTSDAATSIELGNATSGVLEQGIVLGAEHPAGHYVVFGVFSNAPLTRAAIRDGFVESSRTLPGANVVTAELEVQ